MANYFSRKELECKCCGVCIIDDEFLSMLNKAREYANIAFVVNSAYRCKKHNEKIGGSPTSSHLKSCAVDLKAETSSKKFIILNALLKAGFSRIGIGSTFIHVDSDKTKPQNVIWTY